MKRFIYKWWFWIIASLLFLIVLQLLFSISAPCKYLEATWGAGDFISFVGTMVLGYIAISQTQRANQISNKLMDIEINRYKMEIRPFVMVTDWKAYEQDYVNIIFNPRKLYVCIGEYNDKMAICLELCLQNTTESYAEAEFSRGFANDETNLSKTYANQSNQKLRLSAGEKKEIVFYANEKFIKSLVGKYSTVEFFLKNRFGEGYKESFELAILSLDDQCLHKDNEWFCSVDVKNYRIEKLS